MRALLAVLMSVGAFAAQAYELGTHGWLTQEAHLRSTVSQDGGLIQGLGLDQGDPENPFGRIYYDVSGGEIKERAASTFEESDRRMPDSAKPLSVSGWLMRGAIREDDVVWPFGGNPQDDPYGNVMRVEHHFYDPAYNRGLTTALVSGKRATQWGLGSADEFTRPNAPETSRRNHFTVFDAREAMYRALTGRDSRGNELQPVSGGGATKPEDIRKAWWATTFRALGDVLHLVQDMGQPQHTRNDPHAGAQEIGS